jgi:hypothetical protein
VPSLRSSLCFVCAIGFLFFPAHLRTLQNWLDSLDAQSKGAAAAAGGGSSAMGIDAALLAGRALYVNELTRRDPHWGDWAQQADNSLAAPEVSPGHLIPRGGGGLSRSYRSWRWWWRRVSRELLTLPSCRALNLVSHQQCLF